MAKEKQIQPGNKGSGKPINKSQAVLGFIFAFAAIVGLAIGLTRIWVWFNSNYAHKEVNFQLSRLKAAEKDSYVDDGPETYVDISDDFKPLKLTEDWVFKGKTKEKVNSYEGIGNFESDVVGDCEEACSGQEGCGPAGENFNTDCACYLKCECQDNVSNMVNALDELAAAYELTADSLEDAIEERIDSEKDCILDYFAAHSDTDDIETGATLDVTVGTAAINARIAAEAVYSECKDAERVCSREVLGVSCCTDDGEIFLADVEYGIYESQIQQEAYEKYADTLYAAADAYSDCCNEPDAASQESCLTDAEAGVCTDLVSATTGYFEETIDVLKDKKSDYLDAAGDIEDFVDACETLTEIECKSHCQGEDDFSDCYDECFAATKQFCCFSGLPLDLDSFIPPGRLCGDDDSGEECDDDCSSSSVCDLTTLANYMEAQADEIESAISGYENAIEQLSPCCSYEEIQDQVNCIVGIMQEAGE